MGSRAERGTWGGAWVLEHCVGPGQSMRQSVERSGVWDPGWNVRSRMECGTWSRMWSPGQCAHVGLSLLGTLWDPELHVGSREQGSVRLSHGRAWQARAVNSAVNSAVSQVPPACTVFCGGTSSTQSSTFCPLPRRVTNTLGADSLPPPPPLLTGRMPGGQDHTMNQQPL